MMEDEEPLLCLLLRDTFSIHKHTLWEGELLLMSWMKARRGELQLQHTPLPLHVEAFKAANQTISKDFLSRPIHHLFFRTPKEKPFILLTC